MINEIKYDKSGDLNIFKKKNTLALYSTRNYTEYTLKIVKNIILKFKDSFIFYFTYDFYLRSGLYKISEFKYQKVLIIDKKFLHHNLVKNTDAQVIVEDYSSDKRINYLVKDLVILNFVSKILILEATKFSRNLKILSEIASENSIDVFCLPGRISDPASYGTNKIIYDGAIPLFDFELLNS